MLKIYNENYELLMQAIVIQAIEDYIKNLKKLGKANKICLCSETLKKDEHFFDSIMYRYCFKDERDLEEIIRDIKSFKNSKRIVKRI